LAIDATVLSMSEYYLCAVWNVTMLLAIACIPFWNGGYRFYFTIETNKIRLRCETLMEVRLFYFQWKNPLWVKDFDFYRFQCR